VYFMRQKSGCEDVCLMSVVEALSCFCGVVCFTCRSVLEKPVVAVARVLDTHVGPKNTRSSGTTPSIFYFQKCILGL
jgi:hypothetical protein